MDATQLMTLTQYPVSDLLAKLNQKNPRWMTAEVAKSLENSLTQFGCVEPIILNERTDTVIGGHQRIKSALAAGINDLPVSVVNLSPEKELAFNIMLNKVRGEWDYSKLSSVLNDLSQDDDKALIELSGFSDQEIQVILGQNTRAASVVIESFAAQQPQPAAKKATASAVPTIKTTSNDEESKDEKETQDGTGESTESTESTDDDDIDEAENDIPETEDGEVSESTTYGKDDKKDAEKPSDNGGDNQFGTENASTGSTQAVKTVKESADEGVIKTVTNKTRKEVDDQNALLVKVQFGMFNTFLPTQEYDAWVDSIAPENEQRSPIALGSIIAQQLGLDNVTG